MAEKGEKEYERLRFDSAMHFSSLSLRQIEALEWNNQQATDCSHPIRLKSKSQARPPGSPSSKYELSNPGTPTTYLENADVFGAGFPKVSRIHTRVSMEMILTS